MKKLREQMGNETALLFREVDNMMSSIENYEQIVIPDDVREILIDFINGKDYLHGRKAAIEWITDMLKNLARRYGKTNEQPTDAKDSALITGTETDMVNHPGHYNAYDIEVIEMMRVLWGDKEVAIFCKINAFKYRMRAGLKSEKTTVEDLRKEKWYLEMYKKLK